MKKESKIFKAFRYLCLSFVVVVGLVAIIGTGGGGGSGGGGGGTTPLATGEFTKTVDPTDDGDWSDSYFSDTTYHSQNLYPAIDINGSGNITSIFVEYAAVEATDITCADVTIKMGHTTLGSLGTTFATNVEQGAGSVQTVLANASIVFPAGPIGDWVEIPLDTPFYYNGVDNLVVDITTNVACSDDFHTDVTTAFGYTSTVFDNDINAATGITSTFRADMEFQFKGGTNTVISADKTGDNANSIAPSETGRTQMLLLAEHIDGSGPITGLSIFPDTITPTATEISSISVSMIHVAATLLTDTFADNYGGNTPVTVAQDVSYNIPAGQSAAVWVPFNVANFTYDGTSNLLIDISATVPSGGYDVDYKNVPDIRVVSAGTPDALDGFSRARAFEPVLRFNGGTMDVIPSEPPGVSTQVFRSTDSQIMGTYASTELGSKGTITKVAVRLLSDSIADEYPDYRLVMGHSNNLQLTTGQTYLDQMENDTTTYTGTISIPTGLEAGDWVEIPLSTPFTYDPEKNLVVYFDNSASTGGNTNQIRTSTAAPFLNRVAGDSSENSSTDTIPDWTDDHVMHIRLWLQ